MQLIRLPSPIIENMAVAPEQRKELLKAIQLLPIPLVSTMTLIIYGNLSQEQAAAQLKISPQAVSKRKKIAEGMVERLVGN